MGRGTLISGETAVRVMRGRDSHTLGVVAVAAKDFDAKLAALVAVAEERASTLNAYADGLV